MFNLEISVLKQIFSENLKDEFLITIKLILA
jgi:hypothetical protein